MAKYTLGFSLISEEEHVYFPLFDLPSVDERLETFASGTIEYLTLPASKLKTICKDCLEHLERKDPELVEAFIRYVSDYFDFNIWTEDDDDDESPKRGSSSPSPQKKMKPTSNLLKTFGTGNALVMTDLSYEIKLSELNYDPVFESLVISLKRFSHFPFKSLVFRKPDLSNAKQLFEDVYEKIESSKDEKIEDAATIFLKQMRFDDDIESESDLIQTKYSWMRMMSPSASTKTKIRELDFNIPLEFSDFTNNFVYECKKNKVLRLTNIKDLRNVLNFPILISSKLEGKKGASLLFDETEHYWLEYDEERNCTIHYIPADENGFYLLFLKFYEQLTQ